MKKNALSVLIYVSCLFSLSVCFSQTSYTRAKDCNKLIGQKKTIYNNINFFNQRTIVLNQQLKQCEINKRLQFNYQKAAAKSDFETTLAIKDMIHSHPQKAVGIMGRGSIKRYSKQYKDAAFIGKVIAENNYMVITGGGPGVMEAIHLGVWFAGRKNQELTEALTILSKHWDSNDLCYFEKVKEIKRKYPRVKKTFDLSILTYVYGTKLANGFAHNYAVYFNNAIREETIIIAAKDSVILLPGGYGTQIELFMALEYNSDAIETNPSRPIILFNSSFWQTIFAKPFLQKLKLTDDMLAIPGLIKGNKKTP